jgi:hypothetical protein
LLTASWQARLRLVEELKPGEKQTPNIERPTPNAEIRAQITDN